MARPAINPNSNVRIRCEAGNCERSTTRVGVRVAPVVVMYPSVLRCISSRHTLPKASAIYTWRVTVCSVTVTLVPGAPPHAEVAETVVVVVVLRGPASAALPGGTTQEMTGRGTAAVDCQLNSARGQTMPARYKSI